MTKGGNQLSREGGKGSDHGSGVESLANLHFALAQRSPVVLPYCASAGLGSAVRVICPRSISPFLSEGYRHLFLSGMAWELTGSC